MGEDGVLLRIVQLGKEETKDTQCNWVYPVPGDPGWYCTWGYRLVPGADHNDTCSAIFRNQWLWGNFNLTCSNTRQRISKVKRKGRTTMRSNLTNPMTELPYTMVEPITPVPGEAPQVETLLKLLNPKSQPIGNERQQLPRNITRDCVKKDLTVLSLCFWNTGKECEGQNYIVLSSIFKPEFSILRELYFHS